MKTKFPIIILILLPLLLTSCFDLESEDSQFQALKAYFESEKKFSVHFTGNPDNIDRICMGVKKAGTKKEVFYDLSYELKIPDCFKNIMTVKADKSHFSLDDEGLEVTLYFEQWDYPDDFIVVQKK